MRTNSGRLILCDVDQVVADLHRVWLRLYNADYNDTLTVHELVDWDMTKFVKPECGKKIEDYLYEPGLYDYVPMIPDADWGVDRLRTAGHRVVFVTSDPSGGKSGKIDWLKRHRLVSSQNDWIIAHDKSMIHGDILIDDSPRNILLCANGVRPIVFDWPWNRHIMNCPRVFSWTEVPGKVALLDSMEARQDVERAYGAS